MLLSTRDAQLESRYSRAVARESITDRSSITGIDNASFRADSTLDFRSPSILSRIQSQAQIQSQPLSTVINVAEEEQPKSSEKKRYHWRMTHYFYIHISLFII